MGFLFLSHTADMYGKIILYCEKLYYPHFNFYLYRKNWERTTRKNKHRENSRRDDFSSTWMRMYAPNKK